MRSLSWLCALAGALPTGAQAYDSEPNLEEPISDAAMMSQYILPHLEMAGVEVRHGLTFVEVRSLADLSLCEHSQPCLKLPSEGVDGGIVAARRSQAGVVR